MLPSQTYRSLAARPQPSHLFSSSSHFHLRSPCLNQNPSPLPFPSLHIYSGSFLRPASVQKRSPIAASCYIPRTEPAKRMSVTAEMERFVEVANTVADAAGEVLRKYFRQSFEIIDKEDLSTCVTPKKLPAAIFRCNLSTSQPQQYFAANCLDRGQQRIEHDQQWSFAPCRCCPPPQQPCTLLPHLPPIAAAPLLRPRHPQPRSRSCPLLPPPLLLPSDSDLLAASNRYQPPEKSQPQRHCSITAEPQPTLLLPSSSTTIAATLGCHPPLEDFTIAAPTLLPFVAFNLKIAATLFSRFI
ncbi:hypothetical protein BHM03_00039410 [Ensete ventricosum]|nr:hypothetical protein BHM03_00039410 [Ensete ventricosum]